MNFEIRPVGASDHDAWRSMWSQYCAFYDVSLDERVTASTWARIVAPSQAINGLIALGDDGQPLGICNYVCHPNTWSDQTICYLEDLYVAPEGRRAGIATAFIEHLTRIGKQENWARIYWITNDENVAAQTVYDRVAKRTGHIRYEIKLGQGATS